MFPKPEIQLLEDQKRILLHLRKHGLTSRVDMSNRLDINNGVMTRLCRELISLGLLEEREQANGAGRGRPSLPLELRANGAYSIGVTVNSGWADLAVVDFLGSPIAQLSFEYEETDPVAFARSVAGKFGELTSGLSLFRSRFLGFGVSVPGFARSSPSQRHTVERLKAWRGLDLSILFGDEFGGPVWVENDANAAALASYYNGGIMTSDSLLLIYLSYGVGGGGISDGRLFRGRHFNAGEIGPLHPLGQPRPSAMDLVDWLNSRNGRSWRLLDLRDKKEEDDPGLAEWIDRSAQQLYGTILSGICWFDPGAVVICGTLPNWITRSLAQRVAEMDWDAPLGQLPRPTISASTLGGSAAAIGAAILPMHETVSPTTL